MSLRLCGFIVMMLCGFMTAACSYKSHIDRMSTRERLEFKIAQEHLTRQQEREFVYLGFRQARLKYLKDLGLYKKVESQMNRLAEIFNEDADQLSKLSRIEMAERGFLLSLYDEPLRQRLLNQDLEAGWSTEMAYLSLGLPQEILEKQSKEGGQQLWLFPGEKEQKYLLFNGGTLARWAP